MRLAGLLAASLVVALVLQFRFVSLFSFGRFQVGGGEPSVHRAANLFHGQTIGLLAARVLVLLTHASAEQVTQLGYEEMAMQRAPATHLVMIHPQFVLGLVEATLDGPAAEGHAQQPSQRDSLSR
jgi:hypothetical protein